MHRQSRVAVHCLRKLSGAGTLPAAASQAALLLFLTISLAPAQDGAAIFRTRCAFCHGANAAGGERGPSILSRLSTRSDPDLAALIHTGIPGAGMPPTALPDAPTKALIAHLRTLHPRRADPVAYQPRTPAPGDRNWPTYHGDPSGNRHSPLAQITPANVAQLRMAWLYGIPGAQRLQVTPVVIDGVMYVTTVNQVHALDAANGRPIWQYKRLPTPHLAGDAAGGINRGVAIHGDRVLMATDHAHLIALNRHTGALLWDVPMADHRQNYGATSAPLVVGDLVISGTSGGDEGVRGFLAAYRVSTGQRVWRFWTVPGLHDCATAWLTGTYDPQLDLLYWTTGNPCPDYNGDQRPGDNLYSDSVLALRPQTGELVWHFQYTPHDLHDWDAQQTPMLIDAEWQGTPRKLLAQANRNGFFYVLDRATGQFLRATPFVNKLTWAKEIAPNGRPVVNPSAIPTFQGVTACPAVEGATNWFSSAYNPLTGLFYVQALEKCNVYKKANGTWKAGESFYNGTTEDAPEPGQKFLRAIDLKAGRIAWEHPNAGPGNAWGGILSLASGVLFFGEDGGSFTALDATTGHPLWRFPANQQWKASPMTYMLDGQQYIAIASGGNILSFALPPFRPIL